MIKNIDDELLNKKKINVADDYNYLSKMNAMQLIKLILDGKLGNVYDGENKYEEEIKEYELNKFKNDVENLNFYLDDDDEFQFNSSYYESAEYEKIHELNEKYCKSYSNIFTTINNSDYSEEEIDLIIDEINKCSSYYLLGQFANIISNNSSALRELFDKSDKLKEVSEVYMIK